MMLMKTHRIDLELAFLLCSAREVFSVIFCFRLISALFLPIIDCDETYNYWEPSHFLQFGNGFQPLEYSPQFGLRSYVYILIHNIPAWTFYKLFHLGGLFSFYLTRCCLAALCSICETFFCMAVRREFGCNAGSIMLVILIFSPGMFIASAAFLPSSFSMCMTLLSMSSWFNKNYRSAVLFVTLSSLLSWPLAAIIGSPIVFEMVFIRKKWREFLKWCILSTIIILISLFLMDGKFTLTSWNINKYNTFSSQEANLYGNSSWYFYIWSGFLNFNITSLFALSTPFLLMWGEIAVSTRSGNPKRLPYILSLGSLYVWFIVCCTRSHKEEQFLVPVYPLIALCGAVGIDIAQRIWFTYIIKNGWPHYRRSTPKILIIVLICSVLLGVSRILLLHKSYSAPIYVYGRLKTIETNMIGKNEVNLCIGKEWHLFPSSYFLPDGWTINFIKSEFGEQLPAHYLTSKEAARMVRTERNDLNKQEVSRYVNLDACDFLIASDSVSSTPLEPLYSSHRNWTSVYSIRFFDRSSTPLYARFFYVPIIWEWQSRFSDYHLLRRNENVYLPLK